MSNSSCSSNDSVAVLLPHKKPGTEARARSMARAQAVIKAEKEREMASLSALVDTLTEQFSTSLSLTDTSSAGRKCTGTMRQGTPCSKNASKGQLTCQHHRASMSAPTAPVLASTAAKAKIVTEALGKSFEKAVCLLVGCEFQGKYHYSLEKANDLKIRIAALASELKEFQHSGKTDDLYDFKHPTDTAKKLSVKTNTRDWKVCPQGGQGTKKTFCEKFGLPVAAHTDPEAIKTFVVAEISRVLDTFLHSTFHCPILYYNEPSNIVWMVKQIKPIDWTAQALSFSHLEKGKSWIESTTLHIVKDGTLISLGEFQNHAHRNCFKFRWEFKQLLTIFKECFEIRTF